MKKDVIYIDIDDDVTAIIGKVKKAKEKLVVLVPPKRAGALQSAVNLRLLQRMVKAEGKHLILVTGNPALVGLAAAAQIPVAKNLQSKPEIPEVPALIVDDDDDIIDGAEIPVGEHAQTANNMGAEVSSPRSKVIDEVDVSLDDEKPSKKAVASAVSSKASKGAKKTVPDFNKFRKKLFLIMGGGAALIALLVWMFVFAPAATVIITAKTSPETVNATVQLGGTAATSFEKGIITSVMKQEKKDISVEFEATGQKDVGDKATGVVTIGTDSISVARNRPTVPAGTMLTTSGGLVFLTDVAVTLSIENDAVNVSVTAAEAGEKYNTATGNLRGTPSGIYARFATPASGGTTKMARVVTAEDVERATGQLIGSSTDSYKKELISSFANGEKVIDSSFGIERGEVKSTPAVDGEAPDGKASLAMSTTMTIHAVPKSNLETFLKQSLESELSQNQRVFDTGIDKATVGSFRQSDDGPAQVTINSSGTIGPEIDELEVKELVKGRIYGDVQSSLQAQPGIQEVDVKFSYFWVRTIPNNVNKITIEFKVEDGQ